MGSDALQLGK